MENKRERVHDIAEEGLDKIVEGDEEAGRQLIDFPPARSRTI